MKETRILSPFSKVKIREANTEMTPEEGSEKDLEAVVGTQLSEVKESMIIMYESA